MTKKKDKTITKDKVSTKKTDKKLSSSNTEKKVNNKKTVKVTVKKPKVKKVLSTPKEKDITDNLTLKDLNVKEVKIDDNTREIKVAEVKKPLLPKSKLNNRTTCTHPGHNPPMHLYVPPGREFKYTCPCCGKVTLIQGSMISWKK